MPRHGQIKWNLRGFEQLRRSPEMNRVLEEEVKRVLGAVGDFSGDHYEGGVEPGRTRSRGYVVTTSLDAMKDNARNHTLLRALGGGA